MGKVRQAMTLFELVLVLALLVVITAVAIPSVESWYGNYRVTAAADTVRGAWAQARARAMEESRPYRFSVVPNRGNYRLAPEAPEFWSGSGSTGNGSMPEVTSDSQPPLILEETLPKGVRFLTGDQNQADSAGAPDVPVAADTGASPDEGAPIDPSAWSNPVVFFPDGTAREDAELVLRGRYARALQVKLRGLTGVVTSRWLND